MFNRNKARLKKHLKIRTKIQGTSTIPRMSVFRSHKNFEAQLIDDVNSKTLAFVTTKGQNNYSGNIEFAKKLGKEMADKIKKLNIKSIKFDRSGYLFHGRVKAFADAMRSEGVDF